jgi:hypothetical protein
MYRLPDRGMFMRKFERNEPYYVAHWFLTRLIPDLVDKLDLSVYIRAMDDRGRCWSYEKYPCKYTIVINPDMGRRDTLRTIAHESYHIVQYATGKMKDLWKQDKGKVLWKKKIMENAYDGQAYRNAPWEIEASSMEEKLLRAYLRHVKKLQITES